MDAPLHLDAVLTPNRSLPKAGLYVLLGALAVMNLATAALMVLAFKAAPVPIFLGLDFLALALAFRASYRQGRQAERVQVSADEVRVMHEFGARRRTVWRSPTAFTRVELEGADEDARVRLTLSGRSLILARQLSPGERSVFGRALQDAIRSARAERYAGDAR
jgi:uncharacterized membrane protein